MWGFDRASTTLDDLIDFFEGTFKNVVNIRQRTMPVENDDDESSPKVSSCYTFCILELTLYLL